MMKPRPELRRNICGFSLLILAALFLSSCREDARLSSLLAMEQPGVPVTGDRIDELKEAIEEYESVVNTKVRAALRQATYLKLLAQEYMRTELYGPALDALEEAVRLEPRNQVLHQLMGVCAGFIAKAQPREENRARYLTIAESAYLASIEIEPGYIDGLYGLATLYHFELNRHLDAIVLLERLLDRSPSNIPALFVLARSHAALGTIDDAVAAYDRIIENAADRDMAIQARRNRQLLTGEVE